MNFPWCMSTDRILVFGRWLPRMVVASPPRGIWFYRWLDFHMFFVEWVKFFVPVLRAWSLGERLKAGE